MDRVEFYKELAYQAGISLDSFESEAKLIRYTELVECKWKAAMEDLRDAYKYAIHNRPDESSEHYDMYLEKRRALDYDD